MNNYLNYLTIVLFVVVFVYGFIDYEYANIAGPYSIIAIGIMMILSERTKATLTISKGLSWIFKNLAQPKFNGSHIFWGCFCIFMGIVAILFPIEQTQRERELWDHLRTNAEFWIAIAAVIVINVLIGIRASKKDQPNKAL